MFEYDCLDTCCFGCLICMCLVFLYLHLFGAIECVSHGNRSRNTLLIITIIIIIIIIVIIIIIIIVSVLLPQ